MVVSLKIVPGGTNHNQMSSCDPFSPKNHPLGLNIDINIEKMHFKLAKSVKKTKQVVVSLKIVLGEPASPQRPTRDHND